MSKQGRHGEATRLHEQALATYREIGGPEYILTITGLSAEARNWELADYELTELKEVFSDVQDLVPRYQNIPVGDMIDAIITGTISDLDGAIATRDFSKFSAAFDNLTTACNSCHQAANRAYIAIRRPTQSNFSNQDFAPAKR